MSMQQSERVTTTGPLPGALPASFGLAIVGADGDIRSADQSFAAITGVRADEVAGRPLAFFYQHSDAVCAARLHAALEQGHEFSSVVKCRRPDGQPFRAELALLPVEDGSAGPAFVVVLRDMRAVGQTEAELDATSRRFHDLLEHLPAGVVVHDKDARIVALNRLAAELLGGPLDELVGKEADEHNWHLLHSDGRPMRACEFPVCRALRSHTNLTNLVVGVDRGDGAGVIWVLCNTYLVCDDSGALSEAVVCFTDCTELKRTEESLQKSEERLRLVLQGSNDAPWDWDLRTGEIYYSPRWWEMIGRPENELPSDPDLWQRLLHPDDQARVSDIFEKALGDSTSTYEVEMRLRHKDGHYVPVLSRGFILRDEQGRAMRVSGTNTDLTERKEVERNIHQLAYFDYLTGLPNRRFLMDELHKLLSRSVRSRAVGAVLFIDLDNFKMLNDTQGHDVGDLLLRQVAFRLRHSVRDTDYVARLGGDEFVIVLDSLGADRQQAAAEADLVGHKLLDVCGETYALLSRTCRSTPSIGVALFDEQTESVDALLKQADLAMYQAKAAGRNTLRFFDPLMQAAIDSRYALEHDLREGMLRKELCLFCQPQFDREGHLSGGEVLLRWQHPQRGLVGPGEFIDMAESTGLVLPVGRWVLREACRCLAAWRAHPVLKNITLAVNVSAQQMRMADFAGQVLAIIAETGADPAHLSLELTESVLAENMEDLIDKMQALKAAGICFSIDDFGTGYSSLSYLKRFPLATLKIDQSFVHDIHTDPNAAAIAEVIITLARKLGLKVIAEGVEEEGQRRFLQQGGCDGYQGFLFGRPVGMREFERQYGAA